MHNAAFDMNNENIKTSRLIGLSIPKAGTHLLVAIFKHMGYRPVVHPMAPGRQLLDDIDFQSGGDVYVYGHWRAQPEAANRLADHGFRTIVLIRDPRDICLSMADSLKAGRMPGALKAEPSIATKSIRELQISVIEGFDLPKYKTSPIGKICDGWKRWQDQGAVIIRYEDIGRSVRSGILMSELQAADIDPHAFLEAARLKFKPRNPMAAAGRWQKEFDAELRQIWKMYASGVAASLGYLEI
jgi:hypothetical protein